MCSWYSTAREISGISGIYFWSKLCVELSEQRWEKLHCLVNNSALREVSPGKACADGTCRLGSSPGLVRSPCGSVRLDLPTMMLHGGKSCLWCPQAALTQQSTKLLNHVIPRSLCPCASAGRKLLCSLVAGWDWLGWLWLQQICSSPPLFSDYSYFFGTGKEVNSVLPLPSTAVSVLALTWPLLTLKVCIKDDILQQRFGPKGHLSFQGFYPTDFFSKR